MTKQISQRSQDYNKHVLISNSLIQVCILLIIYRKLQSDYFIGVTCFGVNCKQIYFNF